MRRMGRSGDGRTRRMPARSRGNVIALMSLGILGLVAGVMWDPMRTTAVALLVAISIATVLVSVWGMVHDIRRGHVGVDVLAIVALMSTVVVREYWASWIVVVMIFSGRAIEEYAQSRAQRNLAALVDAAPSQAHRFSGPDEWETIPVDAVRVGDMLLVKPGETVPVDAVVCETTATVDMSMITGEPLPVDVRKGETIASGGVNTGVAITVKAVAESRDSQYQKIVDLVRSAQDSRPEAVRTADMLSVPFTVVSFAIAFLAWSVSGDALRFAQVLVIATPCPLLIAAPVAFMGGTGRLARNGIVIKAQDVLEDLGSVSHVFFDKTGTLTVKRPQVSRVELSAHARESGIDADELLVIAGMVESYSSHVLAKGVESAARDVLATGSYAAPHIEDAQEIMGSGVEARVDGHLVRVGRASFVSASEPASRALEQLPDLTSYEMATYVGLDGITMGRVVLRDVARSDSRSAIAGLRDMGVPRITMLTGDNAISAAAIAGEVGIRDVRAGLLPQDKVEAVRQARDDDSDRVGEHEGARGLMRGALRRMAGLKDPGVVTMMVGDGVNDAPVLAAANIGVAMTDGSSNAASQSAQVVIMNDDIAMVPKAIDISRQTRRVMRQAVYGGLAAAVLCMVVAGFGFIPAVWGAIIQEVIDVTSILWALTSIADRRDGRSMASSSDDASPDMEIEPAA